MQMRRKGSALLPLVVAVLPLAGQTTTGPSLGLVWLEADGSVRAIHGIEGAALLGRPLQAPPGRVLALHPSRRLALAATGDGLALLAQSGGASLEPVTGTEIAQAVGFARFSPTGSALVTSSPEAEGRLAVWRLNPHGLSLEREHVQPAARAAVSDDGRRVLADTGEALLLIEADGSVREISRAAIAFEFLADSPAFAVLEPGRLILELSSGDRIEAALENAPAAGWLASPASDVVLLVEPGEGRTRIAQFATDGRRMAMREVPATVTAVAATGEPGLMHLQTQGPGPLWMVRVAPGGSEVFFVPAETLEGGQN